MPYSVQTAIKAYFKQAMLPIAEPKDVLHVGVDWQNKYCHPILGKGNEDTVRAVQTIACTAPELNRYGVSNLWLYYYSYQEGIFDDYGGFYQVPGLFPPEESFQNIRMGKTRENAFESSDIGEHLKNRKIQTILMSGLNFSVCVRDTAIAALKHGFGVWILADATENDDVMKRNQEQTNATIFELRKNGAIFTDTTAVLQMLRQATPQL